MKCYLIARFRMILHRIWPLAPVRALFLLVFCVLGILFLLGDALFFERIFHNLLHTEGIPRSILVVLAMKLMGLVLLTTLTLVFFSAAVSALSFLYLDDDLDLLLPLPIPRMRLYAMRSAQAFLSAGYMVALLLTPIFAAYLRVGGFEWGLFALDLLSLACYLAIPLSLGTSFTVLLAAVFPAKRLHQMLTVTLVIMMCMLVVLFRVSKPEVLLNPVSSTKAAEVIRSIEMPSERVLPSTWLARTVVYGAEGRWDRVLPPLRSLVLTAAGCLAALALLLRFLWWRGYRRSREQAESGPSRRRFTPGRLAVAALARLAPAGPRARAILRRDMLLFFRDPVQWGQLFILAALVVIYLFNVKQMPAGTPLFRIAVSFWNLATLMLIVSAVAGRFAFTSVGSEGYAYFTSRTLPVRVEEYLWAKFLFTACPLAAMAGGILYGSNRFLGVRGDALWYMLFVGVASALTLSVLALAMGCARPAFHTKNPAKAVTNAWGLSYMFLSLLYGGAVLIGSARPVYRYYARLVSEGPPPGYAHSALWICVWSLLLIAVSAALARERLRTLAPG